jgi:hypothetical protein
LKGAVSAGALIFLYPYLSWFYILPVVFCHFLIGSKKYAAGALIVLVAFFSTAILLELAGWDICSRECSETNGREYHRAVNHV